MQEKKNTFLAQIIHKKQKCLILKCAGERRKTFVKMHPTVKFGFFQLLY